MNHFFCKKGAVASRGNTMESETIQKNGVSPKNLNIRSRRKLKIISILLVVIIAFPVWGEQIDEKKALQVATQTLSRSSETQKADSTTRLRTQAVSQKTVQLLYKSSSNNKTENSSIIKKKNVAETVYFYVFGTENNDGFVIVAGDDRVTPVLGYSHTNGFSVENMPPNLKWWLDEYARQIEFAIENDIEPTAEVTQQWAQYLSTNNNKMEE